MYINIFIYFIYIISIHIICSSGLYYKTIYTYENLTDYLVIANKYHIDNYVSVYDKYKTLKKTKVLSIKNKFNRSYYCKNSICVEVNRNALPLFVEIPDEKSVIKRYISESYTYDDELKLRDPVGIYSCGSYKHNNNEYYVGISSKCTSDSQCLTNKCINNYCTFNEENPSEFCMDIYSYFLIFRYSYMHCGKAISDACKKNKECASKICHNYGNYGSCGTRGGPSDSDGALQIVYLGTSFIIFVIILIFYCYIKLIIKYRNNSFIVCLLSGFIIYFFYKFFKLIYRD